MKILRYNVFQHASTASLLAVVDSWDLCVVSQIGILLYFVGQHSVTTVSYSRINGIIHGRDSECC